MLLLVLDLVLGLVLGLTLVLGLLLVLVQVLVLGFVPLGLIRARSLGPRPRAVGIGPGPWAREATGGFRRPC